MELRYQSGFGNEFATEALPGALPVGRNSPQRPPYGLYAEQLSGSAFTAVGTENQRSWLYRIRPSVVQGRYERISDGKIDLTAHRDAPTPEQLRWDPLPYPGPGVDFVDGLTTICHNGSPEAQTGVAVHLYAATASMKDRCFSSADGDFLIVPQEGKLRLKTELGVLEVEPCEIAVVQRGIKFAVELLDGKARGYICENYGPHFRLPYRGPIGANGLANPRDFLTPVAAFEERNVTFRMTAKFLGHLWEAPLGHSPFDVVAWHGNYAPYKYDLRHFNTINTVSFDHPDPSIFTVLTSPSDTLGTANVDFVIFPPRWMVAEDTFRPPYFHRNFMSEYMGLIHGVYDAKPAGGFEPGGGSLHNCMSAHGPETAAFRAATEAKLEPEYLGSTLAFMFESRYVYRTTPFAMQGGLLQKNYLDCWQGLGSNFRRER